MISVSIVKYKTPQEELDKCLQCLNACKLVSSITIIDNDKDNVGYGAGHNKAIRRSHEKYHLVINSDVYFDEGTLEYLYNFMEANPDVGQCAPKTLYPDGRDQYICRLLPTPFDLFIRRFLPHTWFKKSREAYTLYNKLNERVDAPNFLGCFMFFRREALELIKEKRDGLEEYFDERFFLYLEDTDITRRMHRFFPTVFVPEVSITHLHRRASYHSLTLLLVHIISSCKYFNKWGWFRDAQRDYFNDLDSTSVMQRIGR